MKVLMLSRDRSGLDKTSATASRWRLLRDAGADIIVLVTSPSTTAWTEPGIHVEGSGGSNALARFWKAYQKGKTHTCDLVTAQDPLELGWIGLKLARYHRKPFEVQDHGGFFDGGKIIEPFWGLRSLGLMPLVKRATLVRTVSPHSAERLKKQGVYHVRLSPIPADHRYASIERRPEPGLVVAVGRLVPVKRFDRLLRAFAECVKRGTAQKLAILGEGPERMLLEDLVVSLGISERVTFAGQGDPAEYLSRASVFALFSEHEGWGVAWIEAALAGVPVVMTDTGCAPWLKAQGCAVLSEEPGHDADAIECAMVMPMNRLQASLVPTIADSAKAQVASWQELLKPRLLVLMQAVDLDDRLVGYFVEWLTKASTIFASLHVLSLRVGRYVLPANVRVSELRPKGSRSRLIATWRLFKISWQQRHRYDGVFLRGDAIYVVVAGWFWRLLGKKVVLWYTHYKSNKWLPIAGRVAHYTTTAIKESCVIPGVSVQVIGHALDESRLIAKTSASNDKLQCLVLGRVQRIKKIKEIAQDFISEGFFGGKATLTIIGPALDKDYEAEIEVLIAKYPQIQWIKGVSYDEIPSLLQQYDVLINDYQNSLDKVIIEAMMVGLIPVIATTGLLSTLSEKYRWLITHDSEERIKTLRKILSLSAEDRFTIGQEMRSFAIRDHSLNTQIIRLRKFFE